VSGEFAMIKTAAQMGWLDGEQSMRESLTARQSGHNHYLFRPRHGENVGKKGSPTGWSLWIGKGTQNTFFHIRCGWSPGR